MKMGLLPVQIQVGSGGGLTVGTSNGIVDLSIATNDLSDNVITQEKSTSNTVDSSEIISTQVQRRRAVLIIL